MCFQCLYAVSVSSSTMVATQRKSFLWGGKEKYISWFSSKCAEMFSDVFVFKNYMFSTVFEKEANSFYFFHESVNELLILRIFFHFIMKSLVKKFTQTIVLHIKFKRIGSIFRSFFIVSSVPAILWFNKEMSLYSIFHTNFISKTLCRVNKIKKFFFLFTRS